MSSEASPKVGEAVMHGGQPARITAINADGTYKLEYEDGTVVTASADDVERVR